MAYFVSTGDAMANVLQAVSGAKFRGVQVRGYVQIVDAEGNVIGEANDYIYGGRGYALSLCDGSFGGFVPREDVEILN